MLARPMFARRAFTIVELLAAIGVIAVLLAILLPALARSRTRGNELATLSRLKQHVAAFASYNVDHDDFMPYYTSLDGPVTLTWGNRSVEISQYFCGSDAWNMVLGPIYLGVDPDHEMFFPPGYVQEHYASSTIRPLNTTFQFTRVYLAEPEYWQETLRRGWNEHWRPLRGSDTYNPSKKGLLINLPGYSWSSKLPTLVGLVDGSAAAYSWEHFTYPVIDGAGIYGSVPCSGGNASGLPVLHTTSGAAGRDLP